MVLSRQDFFYTYDSHQFSTNVGHVPGKNSHKTTIIRKQINTILRSLSQELINEGGVSVSFAISLEKNLRLTLTSRFLAAFEFKNAKSMAA